MNNDPLVTNNTEDIEIENGNTFISLTTPQPNSVVTSPLVVKGMARGTWFFEANFPVSLYDENNNEIITGVAQAEGEWMTEEFVPFTVTLTFETPATENGKLMLIKANPSGLPENEDQLIIPVKFK